MHHYRKNIGDYMKKAGRLSLLQHGVYGQLIDACYDREKFPTRDEAVEWIWASSKEEVEALDFILVRFFTLQDGVYIQNRIAEELQAYTGICLSNSINGKKGGRPKGSKNNPNESEEKPKETQPVNPITHSVNLESETKANESLTTNHKPLTNNLGGNPPICPHEKIINLYHEILPELDRVLINRWTGSQRAKCLQARWREDPKHQDLNFWKWFFTEVRSSDFYLGNNDRSWKANLEWLITAKNFIKLLEKFVSRQAA